MLRSALLLIILSQYALAQTSAPPQSHEQHPAPAPATQQPGTPQEHSHHAPPGATAAPAPGPQAPTVPAKAVAPTAPVITLSGYCEAPAAGVARATKPAAENCKKVITKAEWERILSAAIPANRRAEVLANPQFVQQIARQYAEILVMANEARKRGIQRRPATQEMLRIQQSQVLAQGLMQDLNEKATPTPAEIEKFYNENKAAFEEAIVRRLMMPKPPAAPPATPPAASGSEAKPAEPVSTQPAPDEAAQKAYAQKARERAVAGEDFDKIQSDAFLFYKTTQAPPTTLLGPRRRGTLPPDHDAAVFALKPGEVSQWFDTPNGMYLYKVESKRTLPLSEAREEISRRIQPQKFNDSRLAIANAVRTDLNPDYFGSEPAAAPRGAAPVTPPTSAAQPRSAAKPAARPGGTPGAAPTAPAQSPQPPTQPK